MALLLVPALFEGVVVVKHVQRAILWRSLRLAQYRAGLDHFYHGGSGGRPVRLAVRGAETVAIIARSSMLIFMIANGDASTKSGVCFDWSGAAPIVVNTTVSWILDTVPCSPLPSMASIDTGTLAHRVPGGVPRDAHNMDNIIGSDRDVNRRRRSRLFVGSGDKRRLRKPNQRRWLSQPLNVSLELRALVARRLFPGVRLRITVLAEQLLGGDAEDIVRAVVSAAKASDPTTMRLCIERLIPVRKDRPITFDLPPVETASNISKALGVIAKSWLPVS
jgi:hypothetical protein